MNENFKKFLADEGVSYDDLADLIGSTRNVVSNNIRMRKLQSEEVTTLTRIVKTRIHEKFRFLRKCRCCGMFFTPENQERCCCFCSPEEYKEEKKKERPEFSLAELSVAARKLKISYGELVSMIGRGLIQSETVKKLL